MILYQLRALSFRLFWAKGWDATDLNETNSHGRRPSDPESRQFEQRAEEGCPALAPAWQTSPERAPPPAGIRRAAGLRAPRPGPGAFHAASQLRTPVVGDGERPAPEHRPGDGANTRRLYLAGNRGRPGPLPRQPHPGAFCRPRRQPLDRHQWRPGALGRRQAATLPGHRSLWPRPPSSR
jgi:hypothetical protein